MPLRISLQASKTFIKDVGIRRRSFRASGRGFSEEKREADERGEKSAQMESEVDQETITAGITPPMLVPSREQVISACVSTSAILGAAGAVIYLAAPIVSPAHGTDAFEALHGGLLVGNIGIKTLAGALTTSVAVTGARILLLGVWEDFRVATDTANTQVLVPLKGNAADLVLVGSLPALTEEFLFRFALLPAISPDWRGAVISGLVFGTLHINGGRNAAFAAWASAVGIIYGYLFLYTESLTACVLAHAFANVLSAAIWIKKSENIDREK